MLLLQSSCQFLKPHQSYSELAPPPPPPPHNNPHTPISSEIASFWTPHLLTLEFPLPSVAEVQIFLELHIVRAHLSGMRERSSVGRENAVILFFFL